MDDDHQHGARRQETRLLDKGTPEAAALEFLNKELEKELAAMKQKRWRDIMLAGAGGVVLGALTGIIIMAVN